MALLNQFQQYSQEENTITNNVLLMLSTLYEISPKYYEDFVKGLTEDSEQYQVIPSFQQQVKNQGSGFIDGYIQIRPSKIIIETKINNLELIEKLLKYTRSFDPSECKILIHLSQARYPSKVIDEIKEQIKKLGGNQESINFFSLTYQDLVDQLKEIAKTYIFDFQVQRLRQNFEEYCLNMNLMPQSKHILRAMACGQSFDLNIKHQFYFDQSSRGFSDFNYLGIYAKKSVKYIGSIENIIQADWDIKDGLKIIESKYEATPQQVARLNAAIKESVSLGWNIETHHTFFLLKDFEQTDFKKTSPGGIFRVRFFHLEQYLQRVPTTIRELASELRSVNWE
jgi:hypothetical protein